LTSGISKPHAGHGCSGGLTAIGLLAGFAGFLIFFDNQFTSSNNCEGKSASKKADEKFLRRRSYLASRANFIKRERLLSRELLLKAQVWARAIGV